mmetsp:Transcript_7846/g.35626  ORF Transcript_7846/g.35626 Transcript_7846/m.35626 type:complete len:154 (+) Transcript_7846:163-624(+)
MSSSCDPSSAMTPPSNTHTLSAPWMVLSLCAMTMDVRPFMTSSSDAFTSRSLSASSAEVASSRSKTLGFTMIARAMAILCFCPPESLIPRSPTHVSRPLSRPRTKSATLARSSARHTSSSSASGAPNRAFAPMLRANNTGSWLTMPMTAWRCA